MVKTKPLLNIGDGSGGTTVNRAPPPGEGTVTVHVPVSFRRYGGRKTLTTPAGTPSYTPSSPYVGSALVRAFARAFRWRQLIENGTYSSIQEVASAEKITPSYVGRVLRLTLLAPHIIESILNGPRCSDMTLDVLMRPFPGEWGRQTR